MLQTHDIRIEHQVTQATSEIHGNLSVNYVNFRRGQAGPGNGGRGQQLYNGKGGQNNGRGHGGRGRGGNKIICQICGRTGHAAVKCYRTFILLFRKVNSLAPVAVARVDNMALIKLT